METAAAAAAAFPLEMTGHEFFCCCIRLVSMFLNQNRVNMAFIETEEQLWRLDWKMGNSGGETHILGKQQALVGVFRPGGESTDWWGQWAGPAERGIRGGHR